MKLPTTDAGLVRRAVCLFFMGIPTHCACPRRNGQAELIDLYTEMVYLQTCGSVPMQVLTRTDVDELRSPDTRVLTGYQLELRQLARTLMASNDTLWWIFL